MELIAPIRRLWSRRVPLAVAFLLAVAATVAIGPPSKSVSAVAWTQVSLDTPDSQLVDSTPKGADSLSWRASLLMHQIATDQTQRRLAAAMGVRADEVAIVDPVLEEPDVPASIPQHASDAAAVTVAPNVLTVQMRNSSLPVIAVEASALDRDHARRLVEAAVDVLASRSGREGAYSSPIPAGGGRRYQDFSVERVGDIRAETVSETDPPTRTMLPLALFGLFATALALMPRPRRRGRQGAGSLRPSFRRRCGPAAAPGAARGRPS